MKKVTDKLLLTAKGQFGVTYYIGSIGGTIYADCSSDRSGSKYWPELPRAAHSERGAKALLGRLTGEKLKWTEAV